MNDDLRLGARRAAVTLRAMTADDLTALHTLVATMSWPHRREDCALLLALGRGVVAERVAGEALGFGMWWPFGASAATIGMVLVEPAQQGRGIGRALMQALTEAAGDRALLLTATAAGLALYERLGFARVGVVHQHQARLDRAPLLAGPPGIAIRAATRADHGAIGALDAAAFGAPRSAMLERLLVEAEAWVAGSDDAIAGYAIRRRFGRGEIIGPVVARDEAHAIALVAGAARAAVSGTLRIDVPAEARSLGEALLAAGLPIVDRVTSMTRGDWPRSRGGVDRFALAMQALG